MPKSIQSGSGGRKHQRKDRRERFFANPFHRTWSVEKNVLRLMASARYSQNGRSLKPEFSGILLPPTIASEVRARLKVRTNTPLFCFEDNGKVILRVAPHVDHIPKSASLLPDGHILLMDTNHADIRRLQLERDFSENTFFEIIDPALRSQLLALQKRK